MRPVTERSTSIAPTVVSGLTSVTCTMWPPPSVAYVYRRSLRLPHWEGGPSIRRRAPPCQGDEYIAFHPAAKHVFGSCATSECCGIVSIVEQLQAATPTSHFFRRHTASLRTCASSQRTSASLWDTAHCDEREGHVVREGDPRVRGWRMRSPMRHARPACASARTRGRRLLRTLL